MNFERRSGRTRDGVRALAYPRVYWIIAATSLVLLYGALTRAHAQTIDEIINAPEIPLENVTDIRSMPLAILAKFPTAGAQMARYVADVVSKQPSVVDAIMSIMDTASPAQASAIGAGIARSARAMEAKGTNVNGISGKVLKSENAWVKTTYRAIGPGYVQEGPFIMPPTIPPAPVQHVYVGDELPDYASRVGPAYYSPPSGQAFEKTVNETVLTRRGMIVAIMASDKDKNGAVSTSPTN
jgi:hypothetical protein